MLYPKILFYPSYAREDFLSNDCAIFSAQTHHAIDQILTKVAKTLPVANVCGVSLWKYGGVDEAQFSALGIGKMQGSQVLYDRSCSIILGATGYGVYQLLENKNFPQAFDWVVFDESSQVLAPYALLSLIFGKGQALFYGDTQQIVSGVEGKIRRHLSFSSFHTTGID